MGTAVYILDPCAGGDKEHGMSYPIAIDNIIAPEFGIDTLDIREDSLARIKGDYLNYECKNIYDIIITNPPFNVAMEIIKKALDDVSDYGYVVMLQRLNFMASKGRYKFFQQYMPEYIFIHSKRISFLDNKATDSIEYAHFVWRKGHCPNFSKSIVLDYD